MDPAGGVPDSFHVCAAWSHDTSLRTGISVVPAARMWTPLGLAAQAATLAQLSSGQFVLGLGTGGYGPGFWASVGLPDRPIAVMREYVTEVRELLAGQQVTAGPIVTRAGAEPGAPGWPRSASLGLADLPPGPVYLAALGPQMLRLAGEIADGTLLNWATPERIAISREQIDAGAARAGREPGTVPMTMYIRVCIDDDVAESDAEVIARLSTVRGIGKWTAEMFLMFQLRRLDVWPTGDLGVRKGFGLAWGIPIPTAKELEPLGDPYRPYRSVVTWYCWRAAELYAGAADSALTR